MKPEYLVILVAGLVFLALWDGVWKLVAMWKSARRNQLGWFICLAILNTAGILPILYLLLSREPETAAAMTP